MYIKNLIPIPPHSPSKTLLNLNKMVIWCDKKVFYVFRKIIFNVRISTGDNRWYIKQGMTYHFIVAGRPTMGNTLISESTTTEYKV